MAVSALQAHLIKRVLESQDEIAPELLTYIVGGATETEIDASIEQAKATTAQLLARAQQQQFRPSDFDGAQFQFQVEQGFGDLPDVRSLSMDEYARFRQTVGIGRR